MAKVYSVLLYFGSIKQNMFRWLYLLKKKLYFYTYTS